MIKPTITPIRMQGVDGAPLVVRPITAVPPKHPGGCQNLSHRNCPPSMSLTLVDRCEGLLEQRSNRR